MVRQRKTQDTTSKTPLAPASNSSTLSRSASSPSSSVSPADKMPALDGLRVGSPSSWTARQQWMFFALASGACAAFNGVFAKLTTTELTTSLSNAISNALGLSSIEDIFEYGVRVIFFALNLVFNGVMWSLFTTALARGTSTTQVAILNTSTNFFVTALMGLLVFSESLPPAWWAGASLLVAGSVIVGRKDEDGKDAGSAAAAAAPEGGYAAVPVQDGEDEAPVDARRKDDQDDEDIIDLGDLDDVRRAQ